MTKKSAKSSHHNKHHSNKHSHTTKVQANNYSSTVEDDTVVLSQSLTKRIFYSYSHIILFILYALLGSFDSIQQDLGTIPYFHIPFFFLPVYISLALYVYTFFSAKLCPTQSANFKKLAFASSGYFLVVISNFFITQDKEKIQLLLYIIALLTAIYLFFLKDTRLNESSDPNQNYFSYEKFLMTFFLIIILVIQVLIPVLYTDAKNQIYYNFPQFLAMGFSIAVLGLTFSKTRLDNLKNFFLVLETIFLVLSIIYFSFILWQYFGLGKETSTPVTDKQIINYAVNIIFICFCNLLYAFLHTYKGWSGAIFKLASTICYVNLFFVANLIIGWY